MKYFLLWAVVVFATAAHALKLSYVTDTVIPHGEKFKKTTLGGLSGAIYVNDKLFALSDDRGQINPPRFYQLALKIEKNTALLIPEEVFSLTKLPPEKGRPAVLDPEGFVWLNEGKFVVSSEGNTDKKPRVMPRLFEVTKTGEWLRELDVPDKFLPEATGKQARGVQNNASFEGLSIFGDSLFAALERPLVQDAEVPGGGQIRIIKYQRTEKFKPVAEYVYEIDPLDTKGLHSEIFRGVSEILALSETQLLVLERGVRLTPEKLYTNTIKIYLADVAKATDVASFAKLSGVTYTMATKTLLIDFETDLMKSRPGKSLDNYEALAWGPRLPDGKRSLLVLSDDNFSKTQKTELLVFSVDEDKK